jgi:hypothetical protein
MPLNLASPGITLREVDLTIGGVSPNSSLIGAIAAPFAKGPVEVPTIVNNERELLRLFGDPHSVDNHYENWMVASSFLSYGGTLRVIRTSDPQIKNAVSGINTSITIKSLDDYNNKSYDENTIPNVSVVARNPGTWANGLKIAFIDGKADQILTGIDTSSVTVGLGVTQSLSGKVNPGIGATAILDGYLKGIVTGIGVSSIDVKVLSYITASGSETNVDYEPNGIYNFEYSAASINLVNNSGISTGSKSYSSSLDWFNQQYITLKFSDSKIFWRNIASRPGTTAYAADRGSRFDEVHIAIIDEANQSISGNTGTILEKHLSLSKAKDALFAAGSTSYWRKYLVTNSNLIFAGSEPQGTVSTGFTTGSSGFELVTGGNWDQSTQSIIFNSLGSIEFVLANGLNYGGKNTVSQSGALFSSLPNLSSAYSIFEDTEELKIDFLLMGSASYPKETAQSLANQLISIAERRKDCIAFISPYRLAFLNDSVAGTVVVNSSDVITENVVGFYSPITSSSYVVFDSGYKYMYDRVNDTFRYVPLNGDIAGICARNDINNFPWFSPAGTVRGAILNAVKLAYNPTKSQRDTLYSNRINPVIFSPGSGIVLFGDKTGLAKSSAFDRINVRRLFVYVEKALESAAKDQLFEFNDEITRSNFLNIAEPFLRDVQAKRGIQDFRVICDETNNTAAVIDNNEFVADIYIKPSRSINFIGLTFVATRSGISFSEIIGNV